MRADQIYTDPLRWRYLKDRTIPLPSYHLPFLLMFANSYLIEGDVPRYAVDPPLRPHRRPHTLAMRDRPSGSVWASTSAVQDDEDCEDESEIMSSLSRIESRLDQVLTTHTHHTARLDHLEQNFERALLVMSCVRPSNLP